MTFYLLNDCSNRDWKASTRFAVRVLFSTFIIFISGVGLAQNLVKDPFFTGTSGAWTFLGGATLSNQPLYPLNIPTEITSAGGSTQAEFSCASASCLLGPPAGSGVSQTIATSIGVPYSLSFWSFSDPRQVSEIDLYWGGTRVGTINPINPTPTQQWLRQTISLGMAATSSTSLMLLLRDSGVNSAITYVDVEPSGPNLTVTNNGPSVVTRGGMISFTVTFANSNGPSSLAASSVTITDVISSGATLGTINCIANGGVICPSGPTFPFVVSNFPAGSTLTFTINATVASTATNTLSNVAALTTTQALSPFISSTLIATASSTVARPALLSITKTNGLSTLVAGTTTVYSIVVSNAGPSDADKTVVSDTPSAGLSCGALDCNITGGGATCPSPLSVNTFLGAGLPIQSFPAGSSLTFSLTCTVTATGQ